MSFGRKLRKKHAFAFLDFYGKMFPSGTEGVWRSMDKEDLDEKTLISYEHCV